MENNNFNIYLKQLNRKYGFFLKLRRRPWSNNWKVNNIRDYRTSPKSHLTVSSELEEIIIGTLLGDLSIEKAKPNSNARLQFKQSIINKIYIEHLYSIFKEYCGSIPKELSYFDNRPNKNKMYNSIKFQTLSLPCFNKYKDLFYNDEGIKIIPKNLENLLTARSLAYWIMDDGYKSGGISLNPTPSIQQGITDKGRTTGFYICTESFTFEEQKFLTLILKNKFNLECGIHKVTNGFRIYIFSSSKDNLLSLIKPYLLPHFYYKFNLAVPEIKSNNKEDIN